MSLESGAIKPVVNGQQSLCDDTVLLPAFCAGEELESRKDLKEKCPPRLEELLKEKDLQREYDMMIAELVNEKKTKKWYGWWVNDEVLKIVSDFQSSFNNKGVELLICEKSRPGNFSQYMWIEYVDKSKAEPDYASVYDITLLNENSDRVKFYYESIKFPEGVAIERLRNWRGRTKLAEKIPDKVQALLEKKDAMKEYNDFIAYLCATRKGTFSSWKDSEIFNVVEDHRIPFKLKGIKVFACHKEEWIHNGQTSYKQHYRWVEFVDLDVLPNYEPARGNIADSKEKSSDNCVIV